ncbi:hypothetical protein [Pseudonocardia alni]|uniref:hypothetical protein n=1 Tax=Pseudonocardia alni TaxID=33907 RepID=UPI00279A8CC8|nr:hypothetical protein PaSha_10585 [Pseudonocardia alni]
MPAVHELAATRADLARLAEAVGPLQELARTPGDLAALAGAVEPLRVLATVREDLATLAAATGDQGAVRRIAAAVADADGTPRLAALDVNLAQAASQLTAVAPDLRSVAARIDALDRQIGVLADALAPLQGTTERIGRIVDRLPDRTRRLVTRPATEG